ncbi:MAG: GIY-YIG nuclease family protein [Terrisporobacter sp.]|uniref:GIY-YIG nuclease family protein n=1 Tax=Terrisporobacter sp. TaxID=1965305 RepID=UPI002A90B466|nr:GIY-YIG nuclease family protein [Terrisporobacter sp.]MDY6153122.1 GIY-YIG nuclease family protein [Terrisporobacter sp.]
MIGIYKIENTENGMVYIGKSDDIMRRWEQHIKSLENNSHANARLQKDWNNYKINCFNFSILRTCDKNELSEYEQFYINKYFNIASIYNSQIKTLDNKKVDKDNEISNNIHPHINNNTNLKTKKQNYIYVPKNILFETHNQPSVIDKILIYMFQCIYNDEIKETKEILLSSSEFFKKMKFKYLTIYRDLKKVENLNIKINNINIIEKFNYKNGVISIILSDYGKNILFNKTNYEKYKLDITLLNKLCCRNSIKMFLLLNQGDARKQFNVDYLKTYFKVPNNAYDLYGNFKRKYIQPMLKDLKSIGYNYTYEEIKFGRKVCKLKFIKS